MNIFKRSFQFVKNIIRKTARYTRRHKFVVLGICGVVIACLVSYDLGSSQATARFKKDRIKEVAQSLKQQSKPDTNKPPVANAPNNTPQTQTPNTPPQQAPQASTKTSQTNSTTPPAQAPSRVAGISSGQFRIAGKITEITKDGMVVETESSNIVTIVTNSKTVFLGKDGSKIQADKITKDSKVSVQVRLESEGQFVAARVQVI